MRNLDYFEPAGKPSIIQEEKTMDAVPATGTSTDVGNLLQSVFMPALPKDSRARELQPLVDDMWTDDAGNLIGYIGAADHPGDDAAVNDAAIGRNLPPVTGETHRMSFETRTEV
jgi:hypothetical protein